MGGNSSKDLNPKSNSSIHEDQESLKSNRSKKSGSKRIIPITDEVVVAAHQGGQIELEKEEYTMLSHGGSFSSASPCAANLPFTPINSTLARSDYIMANPICRRLFIRYVLEASSSWSNILFKFHKKTNMVTGSNFFLSASNKFNSSNGNGNGNEEIFLHSYSIPNFNKLGTPKRNEETQAHIQYDVMLELISDVTILSAKCNAANGSASPPRNNKKQTVIDDIIPSKSFLSIILAILLPWFFQCKEYQDMVESGWTNDVETVTFSSSTLSTINSFKFPKREDKSSPSQQLRECIVQRIKATKPAEVEDLLLDKEWIYAVGDTLENLPFALGITATGKISTSSISSDENTLRKPNESAEESPCPSAYLYTNRALETLTKYPKYELMNQNVTVFDPQPVASTETIAAPSVNAIQRQKFFHALSEGKTAKVGLLSSRKNHELFMNFTIVQPVFDTKGIYKHSLVMSYDVLKDSPQLQENTAAELEKIEKVILLLSQIIF